MQYGIIRYININPFYYAFYFFPDVKAIEKYCMLLYVFTTFFLREQKEYKNMPYEINNILIKPEKHTPQNYKMEIKK